MAPGMTRVRICVIPGENAAAEAKKAIDSSRATLFGATDGLNAAALFYLSSGKRV